MAFTNGLTDAQTERLALLCEELGEAQHAIGADLDAARDHRQGQGVGSPDVGKKLEKRPKKEANRDGEAEDEEEAACDA